MAYNKTFPTQVIVHVNQRHPIEGLAVSLRFGMERKNSFSYMVFLDSKGSATVSQEELLGFFDEQRNAFIMDYGDPRLGFTGEISAKVLSTAELHAAADALRMFKGKLRYPAGYEDDLRTALMRGQEPGELLVEIIADYSGSRKR